MDKRERPDIHTTFAVFSTRVKEHNETIWENMIIMINYLNGKNKKDLTLSYGDVKLISWYVDASFAVQPDFNIHTGAVVTIGQG